MIIIVGVLAGFFGGLVGMVEMDRDHSHLSDIKQETVHVDVLVCGPQTAQDVTVTIDELELVKIDTVNGTMLLSKQAFGQCVMINHSHGG